MTDADFEERAEQVLEFVLHLCDRDAQQSAVLMMDAIACLVVAAELQPEMATARLNEALDAAARAGEVFK